MIKDWRKYDHYSAHTNSGLDEVISAVISTKSPDFTAGHRSLEQFLDAFVYAMQEHYDSTIDIIEHDLTNDDMRFTRTIRVSVHSLAGDNEYYENVYLSPVWIY